MALRRSPSPTIPESSPALITSTSKGKSTASNPSQRIQDQRDILDEILDRLAEGEGIAKREWDGVLKKCFVCDKWMLEAVFKTHSRDCWDVSESEEENDPDQWGME